MASRNEQISLLRHEIASLKLVLKEKTDKLHQLIDEEKKSAESEQKFNLLKRDVVRYARQMIIPQIGVDGQLKLKQSSVLVVGAGGLGCPSALYLAGAGVGHLGLVDYDVVEESNLHRQLLHHEGQVGQPKVTSAAHALKKINRLLQVSEYHTQLSSKNALEVVRQYDVVLDASDNVATRYLINDACVLAGRPLVSGSALQWEGQLTVYHHAGGPCYRCLYPQPPPPHTVNNCSDAGVLGPVPGVIGTLQALEAIKIILGLEHVHSSKLLLFDGENTSFRNVNLRKRNENCSVCGTNPTITKLIDYEQFCGSSANDKEHHLSVLGDEERISGRELQALMETGGCVVVDVRPPLEYQMCSLPRSVNIPLPSLHNHTQHIYMLAQEKAAEDISKVPVVMVCRRGNDSQLAVRKLQSLEPDLTLTLLDLRGGLHHWAQSVDPHFPVY